MRLLVSSVILAWSSWAQPALVTGQHGAATVNSLSTKTVTWAATTAAGDLLVVFIGNGPSTSTDILTTASAVQGSNGSNWTKMPGACGFKASGSNWTLDSFYLANAPAETSFTITTDATTSFTGANAQVNYAEFSGTATSSPLDVCASNTGTLSTTTDANTSGSVTPSVNGELIVGAMTSWGGNGAASVGTGFTVIDNFHTSNDNGIDEYLVQSTAGSISATFTGAANTLPYVAVVAAFKPPAAASSRIRHRVISQ